MKHQHRSLIILPIASFLLLLASCAPHSLDEAEGGTDIDVEFLWDDDPTAAPAQMGLWLYPADGSEPQYYMFSGRDGGRIRVVPGTYRTIAYNADTETVLTSATASWTTAAMAGIAAGIFGGRADEDDSRAGQQAPRAPGTEAEPIVDCVEPIWTAAADAQPLDESHRRLVLHIRRSTCKYELRVLHVDNIDGLIWARATLSGMAASLTIAPNTIAGPLCTLPFDLPYDKGHSTMHATFHTFGHCPEPATHQLMIYTELSDGQRLYYQFDATPQVHAAPDKRHVVITIDRLPLPRADPNANAAVQVSQWETENVSVDMQE